VSVECVDTNVSVGCSITTPEQRDDFAPGSPEARDTTRFSAPGRDVAPAAAGGVSRNGREVFGICSPDGGAWQLWSIKVRRDASGSGTLALPAADGRH
jgi:hypothetical protein